ncbi:hypothetical protein [Planctomycetes bacterium CA13]|uniref:hypothetical protein n=1 Tax=Novipirellula herctigrandis TaxID=2527986 RepID=UPI0011B678D0
MDQNRTTLDEIQPMSGAEVGDKYTSTKLSADRFGPNTRKHAVDVQIMGLFLMTTPLTEPTPAM